MSESIKNKYPKVSQRFKDAMRDNEITAQELANKTGVSKSSISHYVNGSHCPNNLTAIQLASALNVKPEWLMGFDVQKTIDFDYIVELSEEEHLLIETYRNSSPELRASIYYLLLGHK